MRFWPDSFSVVLLAVASAVATDRQADVNKAWRSVADAINGEHWEIIPERVEQLKRLRSDFGHELDPNTVATVDQAIHMVDSLLQRHEQGQGTFKDASLLGDRGLRVGAYVSVRPTSAEPEAFVGLTGKLISVSDDIIGTVRFGAHVWNETTSTFDDVDLQLRLDDLSPASRDELLRLLTDHFGRQSLNSNAYLQAIDLVRDFIRSGTLQSDQDVMFFKLQLLGGNFQRLAEESRDSLLPASGSTKLQQAVWDARRNESQGVFVHHFYQEQSTEQTETQTCEHALKSFPEVADKVGLWPELRRNSEEQDQVLYGTAYAQEKIWDHQHPPRGHCHNASFLIARTGPMTRNKVDIPGIGALLHMLASNLGIALSLGRIMLLNPADYDIWSDDPEFCGNVSSFECYFLPLSSCTILDALDGEVDVLPAYQPNGQSHQEQIKTIQVLGENGFKGKHPPQFTALLESSPLRKSRYWHWWRAQGTTYIARPSIGTRREILRRREKMFPLADIPKATISMHVRHGDKALEVALMPLEDYVHTASLMIDANPRLAARRIFVSTEDPEVIEAAGDLKGQGWDVMYAELERANLPVRELVARFGGSNEVLNGLVNLQLAVSCDAWVCTLSSNWCILIDELRSTVAAKASFMYVDIGGGECPPDRRDNCGGLRL